MTIATDYNGWTNYETWNVALWIQNDETLYRHARQNRNLGYKDWARRFRDEFGEFETPDGVQWLDPAANLDELDDMIAEL